MREVTSETSNYDGLGADLKAARVRTGLDLTEVAEELRIRRAHLHAIEEGLFNDLPAPVYAIGFVRSYADYLGLDGEVAVEAFKQEASGLNGDTKLVFPSPIPESRVPTGLLIAISLVLAGLIYAGWYYAEVNGRLATDRVPAVPERLAAIAPAPTQSEPVDADSAPIGPVETEETPDQGPTITDTVTGLDPATREVQVDLRQVGTSGAETAPNPEGTLGEQPLPGASSVPATAETTPDTSTGVAIPSEPVPTETAPVASETAATALEEGIGGSDTSVPANQSLAASNYGSMEAGSVRTEPNGSADEATILRPETRGPPVSGSPPPQPAVDVQTGESTSGPSESEVPVDAVSDDPYRVDLNTLSSVTESLIKPRPETSVSGADEPVSAEDSSNVTQAAAVEEARQATSPVPEVPAAGAESSAGAAAVAVGPAEDTIAEVPAREDEPQVASARATLGLDLTDRQPQVFGEGNWEARVVLRARSDAWVQIMGGDGVPLLTRILRAGDQYLVPNRDGLMLMTGNAGAIEITVDGQPAPSIGGVGTVRENVSLEPDRLLAGTAVQP